MVYKVILKSKYTKTLAIFPYFRQFITHTSWYMAAFFRQVKIGVLTLTLEKKQ